MRSCAKPKIYCDMDGVLTDFVRKGRGLGESLFKRMCSGDLSAQKEFWRKVDDAGSDWWATMAWLPGGFYIWETILPFEPVLLTAMPFTGCEKTEVGKRQWARRHLGDQYADSAIVTFGASGKAKFAEPGALLIDDRPKNVDKFRDAGGMAVLHEGDPKHTLSQFFQLIYQDGA